MRFGQRLRSDEQYDEIAVHEDIGLFERSLPILAHRYRTEIISYTRVLCIRFLELTWIYSFYHSIISPHFKHGSSPNFCEIQVLQTTQTDVELKSTFNHFFHLAHDDQTVSLIAHRPLHNSYASKRQGFRTSLRWWWCSTIHVFDQWGWRMIDLFVRPLNMSSCNFIPLCYVLM